MKVKASAKMIRISPRKIRLVLDEVRGLPLTRAEQVLMGMKKKGAEPVLKLIRSAAANAVHNFSLDKDTLVVATIMANEGPTMKRYRPRAFGRATMIRKRTSHLIVELEGEEKKTEKKAASKAAPKKKAAAKPAAKKETAKKAEKKAEKKTEAKEEKAAPKAAPKKKTAAKKAAPKKATDKKN